MRFYVIYPCLIEDNDKNEYVCGKDSGDGMCSIIEDIGLRHGVRSCVLRGDYICDAYRDLCCLKRKDTCAPTKNYIKYNKYYDFNQIKYIFRKSINNSINNKLFICNKYSFISYGGNVFAICQQEVDSSVAENIMVDSNKFIEKIYINDYNTILLNIYNIENINYNNYSFKYFIVCGDELDAGFCGELVVINNTIIYFRDKYGLTYAVVGSVALRASTLDEFIVPKITFSYNINDINYFNIFLNIINQMNILVCIVCTNSRCFYSCGNHIYIGDEVICVRLGELLDNKCEISILAFNKYIRKETIIMNSIVEALKLGSRAASKLFELVENIATNIIYTRKLNNYTSLIDNLL